VRCRVRPGLVWPSLQVTLVSLARLKGECHCLFFIEPVATPCGSDAWAQVVFFTWLLCHALHVRMPVAMELPEPHLQGKSCG